MHRRTIASVSFIIISLIASVVLAPPVVLGWQVELTQVSGDLEVGTIYWQEIYFHSDTGADNLNKFFLTLDYDESKVSLAGILYDDYDDGDPFFPETVWDGGLFPHTDNGSLVYNINGTETLNYQNTFLPGSGDTRIARIGWEPLVTETDVTVAVWGDGSPSDFIQVGGEQYWMPLDPLKIDGDPILEIIEDTVGNSIHLRPQWIDIAAVGLPWTANVNTTVILPVVVLPSENGSLIIAVSSSDQNVVSDGSIVVCTDDQGTIPLAGPLPVLAATPVTLYLAVTTQTDENALATTQLTVNVSDTGKTDFASFELTVELAEAALDLYDGQITYRNSTPITLSGEKSRGSIILLEIDGDAPIEIVSADVDGDWSYDWDIPADGSYDFELINQAGSVAETFASGTMVLDTLPPVVPIDDRTITGVSFNRNLADSHQLNVRADAPVGADSNRFAFCLDDVQVGSPRTYGEVNFIAGASDDVSHQAVAIPVDAAGNRQMDCSGDPVAWTMTADRTQIEDLQITLVEPVSDPAYVEIKWPVDDDTSIDDEVRVWAKHRHADAYSELSGAAVQDAPGSWWVFEDHTSPARIRSYKLTDASGLDTLVEFERRDDPDAPVEPLALSDLSTNIAIPVGPVLFTLTPNESAQLDVTTASNNTSLVPNSAIEIWTDAQGSPIVNPIDVIAGIPVDLYLYITPADHQAGTAAITVTVANHNDAGKTTSADFDLNVELSPATLDAYGGETTYFNITPVTLSGQKGPGSRILFQIGSGSPLEIVGADVTGAWSYDWDLPVDGTYNFSLINQAGSVQEIVATGTVILDTLPPVTAINARTITGISFNTSAPGTHSLSVRAIAPAGADSSAFSLCLDDVMDPDIFDYGDSGDLTADDGTQHQAVPIPVDQAGNRPLDCNGNAVSWQLDVDRNEIEDLVISLIEPGPDPAYVEIKWSTTSPAGGDVRVWAKSLTADDYVEVSGIVSQDALGDWWVFEDTTTPARIRTYRLTDTTGQQDLMTLERLDDPQVVDPGDDDDDDGGGGGGGGCFMDTVNSGI